MAIEVFNRVEEKYIVNENQYRKIVAFFGDNMKTDEYSSDGKFYQICNIYYDTEDNNLIRTSLMKPIYKEKIRLRSYGVPNKDTKVYLDVKKKYKGVVNKRRSTLRLKEAYEFTETREIPKLESYMNPQVLRELKHSLEYYDAQPKVFLSYERQAFFGSNDSSFRLTFDKNIITRREDIGLENGIFGSKLIDDGTYIMEVKYIERMPLWFVKILRENDLQKTSFSKYGTEYKKYIAENEEENYVEVRKYA